MKRTIIIILALVFSVAFCAAQGQDINKVKQEIELKYQNAMKSAKEYVNQGRYDAAINKYQEAKNLIPDKASIIDPDIENVKRLKAEAAIKDKEKRFNDAVASAERSFAAKEYVKAKSYYEEAISIKPESAPLFADKKAELDVLILEEMKIKAEEEIDRLYEESIAYAQINILERRYAEAKRDYISARELKPDNADYINSKIAELEKPAMLHIYRNATTATEIFEDGVSRIFGVRYDVIFDDKKIGVAKSKWKITETVNELETKTVWAAIDGRSAEVHIDFDPGKVYYVRCGLTSKKIKTGVWKTTKKSDGTTERYEEIITEYTPTLELIDESIGEREFKSIKSQ